MLTASPWSFGKNHTTGAHRVRRRLEATLVNGQRLRVDSVVLVQIGKWRGYEAQTSDGLRWARIENGHVVTMKERPTC